jgi:hypothetical protein
MANQFDELMAERKPIEDALRTWMFKWIARERERGVTGDPFLALRPIDEVVKATIPELNSPSFRQGEA